MKKIIAVLSTLDTKGRESAYLREQIEALGARALLVDIGVVGQAGTPADVTRAEVAEAGGTPLAQLLVNSTRQTASPVMIAGATRLLQERLAAGELHAVLGLGGTQGTSNCTAIMQTLPYGLPKIMVSTVASGDTSAFVGIKDITMMFSVSDILGLNPLTCKILANAAAAAVGMANSEVQLDVRGDGRPVVGMTNLGVLTEGANHALALFEAAGYPVIVFHAVGSGGKAMEQMMKEGIISAVFDYALGEIADEVFHGLRAGGPQRLTVAGELGLPQVICPGGADHLGFLVEADTVPERWRDHKFVFHNPIILAPRVNADEMRQIARETARRLQHTQGQACFLVPTRSFSRYGIEGGPLHDPEADRAFVDELRGLLPPSIELVLIDADAEDPLFVAAAVERLIAMIEGEA
jgi:uncharacterized protein (UPF0261 family)